MLKLVTHHRDVARRVARELLEPGDAEEDVFVAVSRVLLDAVSFIHLRHPSRFIPSFAARGRFFKTRYNEAGRLYIHAVGSYASLARWWWCNGGGGERRLK